MHKLIDITQQRQVVQRAHSEALAYLDEILVDPENAKYPLVRRTTIPRLDARSRLVPVLLVGSAKFIDADGSELVVHVQLDGLPPRDAAAMFGCSLVSGVRDVDTRNSVRSHKGDGGWVRVSAFYSDPGMVVRAMASSSCVGRLRGEVFLVVRDEVEEITAATYSNLLIERIAKRRGIKIPSDFTGVGVHPTARGDT